MFKKSGTAFFWGKKAPAAISKVGTKLKNSIFTKNYKKHRFLNLDMSKTSGTAFFWEKKAPAAISKAGTKLDRNPWIP